MGVYLFIGGVDTVFDDRWMFFVGNFNILYDLLRKI